MTFHSNYHILLDGPQAVSWVYHKAKMCVPISKVPILFLESHFSLKVQSQKLKTILIANPLQIKPQVTYLPHTMVQNYTFERKEWVYSGKTLDQSKTKSQEGKYQLLYDQVQCQNC